MEATHFFWHAKTGFSPKMTLQWRHRCAKPTSKYLLLSCGSDHAFTDSLA